MLLEAKYTHRLNLEPSNLFSSILYYTSFYDNMAKTAEVLAAAGRGKGARSKGAPRKKAFRSAAMAVAQMAAGFTSVKGAKARRTHNAFSAFAGSRSAPTNTSFTFVKRNPVTTHVKNGVRIRHTELIGDVETDGTVAGRYHCVKYTLNPADSDTFQWLSSTARAFSMYKFHSLTVHVKSLVGTETNGMVAVATTPDVTDGVPSNKTSFMNYQGATRANAWQGVSHTVQPDVLHRLPEYVTSSNNTDVNMNKQVGALFICTQGAPVGTDIGEAYISYDVTLLHPQEAGGAAVYATVEPIDSAHPFGTLPSGVWSGANQHVGSNIALEHVSPYGLTSDQWIKVNGNGSYFVTIVVGGTSLSGVPDIQFKNGFDQLLSFAAICVTSSSTQAVASYRVINAPKPFFIQNVSMPTNVTYSRFSISAIFNAPTDENVSAADTAMRRLETSQARMDVVLSGIERLLGRAAISELAEPDDESPIHVEPRPTPRRDLDHVDPYTLVRRK